MKSHIIRAYAYVRVSTNKQLDNTSIEKQVEEIKKYCKEFNIILVKIFIEEPASAESFSNRPQFKEMFYNTFKKENNIDTIIVFKQDRISRNSLDAQYIFNRLTRANKNLISIADNINTDDPNSKLIYQILSIVAEVEKDLIAFRTSLGMEKTFENGEFNGGKVFGYHLKNKKLVIDPEEAKVIKYIYESYANKMWGYRKIANNLNMQGKKTKNNKHWSINSVKTILKNKIYIGDVKWKGQTKKGKHQPIIDEFLWNKTQNLLSLRGFIQEKLHPGSYPLSGLLKCPECSGSMVQGNANKKNKYYVCSRFKNSGTKACKSNLVLKENAEEVVFSQVLKHLKDMELSTPLEKVTNNNIKSEIEPLELELKSIKNYLKEIIKEKHELLELYHQDIINIDTLKGKMEQIQNDEKEKKEITSSLEKQINLQNDNNLKPIIRFIACDFEFFYDLLSDSDKKQLLHSLIKDIYISRGDNPKDRQIKDIVFRFDKSVFI